MRSYEAARTYFSILSFVSWCVIGLGAIVALVAMTAMGQMSRSYGGSSMAGLTGILPGLVVAFSGFMGLVLAQIGRAGVDTAEYTQQMLKIARDQLEVSKQGLKANSVSSSGFASTAEKTTHDQAPSSFATRVKREDSKSPVEKPVSSSVQVIEYGGKMIRIRNGNFSVNGIPFKSMQEAERHIDSTATKDLPGANEPPKNRVK